MTAFDSKSIFLWNTAAIAPPSTIAAALVAGGFESVSLHGQNLNAWRSLHSRAEVDAYKAAGLGVIGSVAVYGYYPDADGKAAAAIAKDYQLDGMTFDIESTFERQADTAEVETMMKAYRAIVPALPTAWCSWPRFWRPRDNTAWHPVALMAMGMRYCDYGMPMVYSPDIDSTFGVLELMSQSIKQWRDYTDKPLVMAGRAYNGEGYTAKPEHVTAFADAARTAGCPGVTWWAYDYAVKLSPIWQALAGINGFAGKPVESQLDRIERMVREIWEMGRV